MCYFNYLFIKKSAQKTHINVNIVFYKDLKPKDMLLLTTCRDGRNARNTDKEKGKLFTSKYTVCGNIPSNPPNLA